MKDNRNKRWINIAVWGMGIIVFTTACNLPSNFVPTPTATITGGGRGSPPQIQINVKD